MIYYSLSLDLALHHTRDILLVTTPGSVSKRKFLYVLHLLNMVVEPITQVQLTETKRSNKLWISIKSYVFGNFLLDLASNLYLIFFLLVWDEQTVTKLVLSCWKSQAEDSGN